MKRFLPIALSFPVLFAVNAHAQYVVLDGNNTGASFEYKLSASDRGKILAIVVPPKDANTQTLAFGVSAPPQAKVSALGLHVARGQSAHNVFKAGAGIALNLLSGSARAQRALVVPGTILQSLDSGSTPGDANPFGKLLNCGCLTESEVGTQLALYKQVIPNLTREYFCSTLMGERTSCDGSTSSASSSSSSTSPTGPGENGLVAASAFVSFDRCSSGARPAAVVLVDLRNIGEAALSRGTVLIQTEMRAFRGNKKASIKPSGDGKVKGALLLYGPPTAYAYGRNLGSATFTQWRGTRILRSKAGRPVDLVYYGGGGGVLVRTSISAVVKALSGRAVIEVKNGADGYSMCGNAGSRGKVKRQQFNGYFNY